MEYNLGLQQIPPSNIINLQGSNTGVTFGTSSYFEPITTGVLIIDTQIMERVSWYLHTRE